MAKIEDVANEMFEAKEQLKNINNTINRDRAVLADVEKSIEAKKSELKDAEKKIKEKEEEIASLDNTKKAIEKDLWDVRDNLKAERTKLSENKKKDETKYQISIEELSNDVRVLTGRKEALKWEIDGLEMDVRKAKENKIGEIWKIEDEIKGVKEKLDGFNLLFDQQNAQYNKVNGEIKDMNEKLEKQAGLDAQIKKLEWSIDKQNKKYAEVTDKVIAEEDKLAEIREEIKKLEKDKMDAAAEVADYVKKKMDIKDRNDKLDLKEKYLRKKYEEAWLKFD